MDIISTHNQILEAYEKRATKLDLYIKEIERLNSLLKNITLSQKTVNDIQSKINDLNHLLQDIQLNISLTFYLLEAEPIIFQQKEYLKKPVKVNFMGKKLIDSVEKKRIEKIYRELINKYYTPITIQKLDLDLSKVSFIDTSEEVKNDVFICNLCKCKKCDINDNICICIECGFQKKLNTYHSCYKDVDRVSITKKYKYDKRVHFRDCINQFQAKQNSTISDKVYKDLDEQFLIFGLLRGDINSPKEERYKDINKEHIYLFLNETGHSKHYEDVTLIYCTLTGKTPNDISEYEERLMSDYDLLVDLYDRKYKNKVGRENFIHTDYVLYQLLRKYGFPCKKEDFDILKTIDRRYFCDDVCKELFEELGWNFTPYF